MLRHSSPLHRRRTTWIVSSLGLLALLIAAAAAMILRVLAPPTPPPDRLAAVESLIAHFDQLVFGGYPSARVRKWNRPIQIVLYGASADDWRPVIDKHAATLAEYTSLDITILSEKYWRGNYFIHLVEHSRMYDLLQDYDQNTDPDRLKKIAEDSGGVAFLLPKGATKITQAVSIVSTDYSSKYVDKAILHEFVHGLGMLYHSKVIHTTITNGRRDIFELSVNDKLALRVLYDDRIESGMWRPQALHVARGIIAELVEEARAQEAATAY